MDQTVEFTKRQERKVQKIFLKYTFDEEPSDSYEMRFAYDELLRVVAQAYTWTSYEQMRRSIRDPGFNNDATIIREINFNGKDVSTKSMNRAHFFRELKEILSPDGSEFKCVQLPSGNEKISPHNRLHRVYYTWDDNRNEKTIKIHPLKLRGGIIWDIISMPLLDDIYSSSDTEPDEDPDYDQRYIDDY